MKETSTERKRPLFAAVLVFIVALLLRTGGSHQVPPFDDLYHLKRIEFSLSQFPHMLEFDVDRGEGGAFCPWPPLYDLACAALLRLFGGITLLPPIFFAAFAAAVTVAMKRFGALAAATAGLTLALSPYLIGASGVGHIDHHYVEPLLLLSIVLAASRRHGIALAVAITAALFVQTALIVAAGLAFFALFFSSHSREGIKAFAIPAVVILAYRLSLPSSYPDSAWFLGFPHAALLGAAAVACALRERARPSIALAGGAAVALMLPPAAGAFLSGLHFFGSDPWLSSIIEFQPMFRDTSRIGTDLANLTGGALLALLLWRNQRTFALFASAYLLLALSSRRFLVPSIALFAVGGALVVAAYAGRRTLAYAAALATLLPPLAYDIYTFRVPEPSHAEFRVIGERLRDLPPGRVLAPWSFGHAIDVIGRKPVVIDNFGSMPDERVFTNAIAAMLSTREATLLRYCRDRRVRYLVLPHPAYVPVTAATIGGDPALYSRTRLARRTVWSRLYGGEHIAGFELVSGGAVSIWKIE